jgi:hypothetical protein
MTRNTRYDLTQAEAQAFEEATTEEIVTAAAELARDPGFWMEMVRAFGNGFLRGLTR